MTLLTLGKVDSVWQFFESTSKVASIKMAILSTIANNIEQMNFTHLIQD